MILRVLSILSLVFAFSCVRQSEQLQQEKQMAVSLTLEQANHLAKLPIKCIQNEYPNKLGQTLKDSSELGRPKDLHPAFYGCFDWHSAVHGHWMLVKLLKAYPELEGREEIINMLNTNISKYNIEKEIKYFNRSTEKSYERTYGWAWLLKLTEELHTWENEGARVLESNLQPLTDLIVERFMDFLLRLYYPIRVGEHTNTAFGLAFAWDYANTLGHSDFKELIEKRAREFYINDVDCPISWEPSGYDFLSPCLEEADLMRRVLSEEEYLVWLAKFLPQVMSADFDLEPGIVTDREDGKLVHLDGVNFSRAWCLYGISLASENLNHLIPLANKHINYSLKNITDGAYEGEHWLASFAIFALSESTNKSK